MGSTLPWRFVYVGVANPFIASSHIFPKLGWFYNWNWYQANTYPSGKFFVWTNTYISRHTHDQNKEEKSWDAQKVIWIGASFFFPVYQNSLLLLSLLKTYRGKSKTNDFKSTDLEEACLLLAECVRIPKATHFVGIMVFAFYTSKKRRCKFHFFDL